MKRIELKLVCELGEYELLERGQALAETQREAARLAIDKAAAMKSFKEQLEDVVGRMRETAEAIREKREFRMVACEVSYHRPAEGQKRTVRLDTGELVKEEPMTMDECQGHLYEGGK